MYFETVLKYFAMLGYKRQTRHLFSCCHSATWSQDRRLQELHQKNSLALRCQPCKATASSSGTVRVRRLAQRLLDTRGGAGDRTSNLPIASQPLFTSWDTATHSLCFPSGIYIFMNIHSHKATDQHSTTLLRCFLLDFGLCAAYEHPSVAVTAIFCKPFIYACKSRFTMPSLQI